MGLSKKKNKLIFVLILLLLVLAMLLVIFFKTNEAFDDNKDNVDSLYTIINPLSPYFICDHYVSTEIFPGKPKSDYWTNESARKFIKGNNLLENKNYSQVKKYDLIQCQVDHLNNFIDNILPKIEQPFILITSQCHLPQINKTHHGKSCDEIFRNKKIILWISQNPIFRNKEKYMAFPYGIKPSSVIKYHKFIKNHSNIQKNIEVSNLKQSVFDHLNKNHIRKKYDILGIKSGERLKYDDFLKSILASKFLISTVGDRDDCYRHYEAIGLETIPISNITKNYYDIFGESMYVTDEENVYKIAKSKKCDKKYWKPNKNIIYLDYWKKKIDNRIQKIKNNYI